MHKYVIFAFLFLAPFASTAQCFQSYMDEGKRLLRAGDYDAAMAQFAEGKRCEGDKPADGDAVADGHIADAQKQKDAAEVLRRQGEVADAGRPPLDEAPDSDGDGVPDKNDRCPNEAGPGTPDGCPAVEQPPHPDLVLIKGGSFQMGNSLGDSLGGVEERPPHLVTVADFYLSKHELSFDEYDSFCEATGRALPTDQGWGRGNLPVIDVSWYDAIEYCNWRSREENLIPVYRIDKDKKDAKNTFSGDNDKWTVEWIPSANGYRLPTEAEWEYAARERGRKLRFGNGRDKADPSKINFNGSPEFRTDYSFSGKYRGETVPVDELQANSLGLKNMSGNVWEWCWDWYASDYYVKGNGARNPLGAAGGLGRTLRGGSWYFQPKFIRTTFRVGSRPDGRANDTGIRLARSK
jgi:formylglycine-generating enzyme required for sulfatase activity